MPEVPSTLDIRRTVVMCLTALVVIAASGRAASQESPATAPSAAPTGRDTSEAHLGKGYDALKQDMYEAAVSEFQAALQLDPTLTWRARFPLAVAYFELHRSDDARRELETIRREVGDHPNVLYYLGRLDVDDRKFESAIRNLNRAAAKPPFPDTAYYLGFAYFKHGDLPAAEKWLKEAVRINPHDPQAQYQLGFVYRKEGREEEARKTLAASEESRRHDNSEARLKTECGKKLDQGPREEARTFCDQLYAADDADKLTALGTLYGQHGDLEAALKPFRRAAELNPRSPQAQYNLALAYYQTNQFEAARAALAKVIDRWPDLFQLNALYGAVLLKLGEDGLAYRALHHARQLNPQDSSTTEMLYTVTLTLALKNKDARQFADSLHYLEEAVKLRPQEPEPHRSMAELYILTNHPAQASAEQREADRLTKNPAN